MMVIEEGDDNGPEIIHHALTAERNRAAALRAWPMFREGTSLYSTVPHGMRGLNKKGTQLLYNTATQQKKRATNDEDDDEQRPKQTEINLFFRIQRRERRRTKVGRAAGSKASSQTTRTSFV